MIASKDNWQDVKKYYHSTYVKFPSEGERIWLITSVTKDHIFAEDSSKEQVCIELERPFHIDYVLPKKAVYQFGDTAAQLVRLPYRMWKKGLCAENTSMFVCGANGVWANMPFSIENIEGFVNKPGYYCFADAKNNFENGEQLQSCALSPRVSLTRKGGVFIDSTLVGRLNKTGLSIKDVFVPDISPLFPEVKVKAV